MTTMRARNDRVMASKVIYRLGGGVVEKPKSLEQLDLEGVEAGRRIYAETMKGKLKLTDNA